MGKGSKTVLNFIRNVLKMRWGIWYYPMVFLMAIQIFFPGLTFRILSNGIALAFILLFITLSSEFYFQFRAVHLDYDYKRTVYYRMRWGARLVYPVVGFFVGYVFQISSDFSTQ
jgi:hypothetical protein